jgi:DNA replicative helicase MCM subunit Mcm2 (Cdc46/Mcm family)
MASYINLKLSLLLSIVSINSQGPPIPIVATGENIGDASAIMNHIGSLANRFLRGFESGVSINKKSVVEAGPLLLAKSGVCFLDDWSGLKNLKCARLIREVETGRVMVEKTFQTFPVECAVWTYWSVNGSMKKDLMTMNQFISVFGILIVLEDDVDQGNLIDFVLEQATNLEKEKPNELQISDEDMRTFLNFVSTQSVSMTKMAEKMLRDYFLVTRVNRPSKWNFFREKYLGNLKYLIKLSTSCS